MATGWPASLSYVALSVHSASTFAREEFDLRLWCVDPPYGRQDAYLGCSQTCLGGLQQSFRAIERT